MATTYALAGVAAGLTGTLLSAALQNIWVLGSFALIFVVLAFSMFGFYELQLPASLQGKLSESANRLPGGQWLGLFGMGALSALIVGPCVAAPLAGALLYIGQTGNALFGGSALFVMAMGMGVPLLLVGLSAGTLLPKAGPWMEWVKRFFGVLLLATAVWLVYPLLPSLKGHISVLPFERVATVSELDQRLNTSNKPVMLDFYADWCVSCKEMEKFTFSDPKVQAALKDVVLLQADVTANNADDSALLKRFDLFGPPGIIFFDPKGQEIRHLRVVGYKDATEFLDQIRKWQTP
jgi:thiol:disulfide interchange protein DsbD